MRHNISDPSLANSFRLPIRPTVCLTGCSAIPDSGLRNAEFVWQLGHAVDVAQTLKIVDDPCFKESNALTKKFIGSNRRPSA